MFENIVEVNSGNPFIAYLGNFPVDESDLTAEHKTWIDTVFRIRAGSELALSGLNSSDYVQIRLFGTASRTGSASHNLALSQRRAKALEQYIEAFLARWGPKVKVSLTGLSEAPAALLGKEDEQEDAADRAVIIYMRRVAHGSPEEKAPVVVKRRRTGPKTFFIGVTKFQADSLNISIPNAAGIGGRVDRFKITFKIADSKERRRTASYSFEGWVAGMTALDYDRLAEDAFDEKFFVGFKVPRDKSIRDFSGPAMFDLPFLGHNYTLYFGGVIGPDVYRFHVQFLNHNRKFHGVWHGVRPGSVRSQLRLI